MKNKLFLLPILALGTLLGACKEKIDPIYIDEWLNNAKNVTESDWPGRFYFRDADDIENDSKDFGLNIAKEIKNIVKDIKSTPIDETTYRVQPLMKYAVYAKIGAFNKCQIDFYDDGFIDTHASYMDYNDASEAGKQNFRYDVGKEKISSLYETFKNTYKTIQTERAKEDNESKNKVSIENFLTAMDESKATHYINYTVKKENQNPTDYRIEDTNLSFLSDIKELEFNRLDSSNYIYSAYVSYYINDEWALVVPNDSYDKVSVRYINVNSKYRQKSLFSEIWYYANYSVNHTKLVSLIEKIENQVKK